MPMSKCKIYRLSATIEEKLDYYAMERKVARHEAPKRYNIVTYKGVEEKTGSKPLLPIISDSSDAIYTSPLAAMVMQARQTDETEDDAFASLLNPVGPWNLETMLQVPDCLSRIRFSFMVYFRTNLWDPRAALRVSAISSFLRCLLAIGTVEGAGTV